MESKAIFRYARLTPMKARRVADLIRGKKAGEALTALRFMPYRGARFVAKVLRSAMANAEQKNADPEAMRISRIFVDDGPRMKRMEARAQGRANVIRKKTSHITVYLSDEGK
jgi:large subunit ribosomal protein L22